MPIPVEQPVIMVSRDFTGELTGEAFVAKKIWSAVGLELTAPLGKA